jgi:thiol-disulfide isomerase/thioredoxin
MLVLMVSLQACNSKSKTDSPLQNPRELTENEARIEAVIHRTAFEDLEGNEVYISDFAGKVVLVDFWETWCGPCLQVFPAMDSLKAEYPDDFEVLTVNLMDIDTREEVIAFVEKNGYNFTHTVDVNEAGPEVITLGIPFKVFFDPQGFLIKAELGSAGTQGDYEKAKVIIEDNKQS